MAETTGLLNRRTGHSVPRVRISSSPQGIFYSRLRSSWLFCCWGPESLLSKVPNGKKSMGSKNPAVKNTLLGPLREERDVGGRKPDEISERTRLFIGNPSITSLQGPLREERDSPKQQKKPPVKEAFKVVPGAGLEPARL